MDLDAKKTGIVASEQQRRRPACAYAQSDQCIVIHYLESTAIKLIRCGISLM